MSKPWDLDALLECVRDDLHPDQIRSLIREAYDAGQRRAVQTLRDEAAWIAGATCPTCGGTGVAQLYVDPAYLSRHVAELATNTRQPCPVCRCWCGKPNTGPGGTCRQHWTPHQTGTSIGGEQWCS